MVNPIDFICAGVFIGGQSGATDINLLKQHGVTHIINAAAATLDCFFPQDFVYKPLKLVDTPSQNILQHFSETTGFITDARMRGGRVLVHCIEGKSRSASIVLAYLMDSEGMTLRDAYALLRRGRPIANPNEGFQIQLQHYDSLKRGNTSRPGLQPQQQSGAISSPFGGPPVGAASASGPFGGGATAVKASNYGGGISVQGPFGGLDVLPGSAPPPQPPQQHPAHQGATGLHHVAPTQQFSMPLQQSSQANFVQKQQDAQIFQQQLQQQQQDAHAQVVQQQQLQQQRQQQQEHQQQQQQQEIKAQQIQQQMHQQRIAEAQMMQQQEQQSQEQKQQQQQRAYSIAQSSRTHTAGLPSGMSAGPQQPQLQQASRPMPPNCISTGPQQAPVHQAAHNVIPSQPSAPPWGSMQRPNTPVAPVQQLQGGGSLQRSNPQVLRKLPAAHIDPYSQQRAQFEGRHYSPLTESCSPFSSSESPPYGLQGSSLPRRYDAHESDFSAPLLLSSSAAQARAPSPAHGRSAAPQSPALRSVSQHGLPHSAPHSSSLHAAVQMRSMTSEERRKEAQRDVFANFSRRGLNEMRPSESAPEGTQRGLSVKPPISSVAARTSKADSFAKTYPPMQSTVPQEFGQMSLQGQHRYLDRNEDARTYQPSPFHISEETSAGHGEVPSTLDQSSMRDDRRAQKAGTDPSFVLHDAPPGNEALLSLGNFRGVPPSGGLQQFTVASAEDHSSPNKTYFSHHCEPLEPGVQPARMQPKHSEEASPLRAVLEHFSDAGQAHALSYQADTRQEAPLLRPDRRQYVEGNNSTSPYSGNRNEALLKRAASDIYRLPAAREQNRMEVDYNNFPEGPRLRQADDKFSPSAVSRQRQVETDHVSPVASRQRQAQSNLLLQEFSSHSDLYSSPAAARQPRAHHPDHGGILPVPDVPYHSQQNGYGQDFGVFPRGLLPEIKMSGGMHTDMNDTSVPPRGVFEGDDIRDDSVQLLGQRWGHHNLLQGSFDGLFEEDSDDTYMVGQVKHMEVKGKPGVLAKELTC